MSMQLFNEVQELRQAHAQLRAEFDALRQAHAEAMAQLHASQEERRAAANALRKIESRVESLWSMKDAIAKDARDVLGRRGPIDPTKAKMPETLRRLGFEQGKS